MWFRSAELRAYVHKQCAGNNYEGEQARKHNTEYFEKSFDSHVANIATLEDAMLWNLFQYSLSVIRWCGFGFGSINVLGVTLERTHN